MTRSFVKANLAYHHKRRCCYEKNHKNDTVHCHGHSVTAALPVSAVDMNEYHVATEVESAVAAPRATKVPTAMAPASWYNIRIHLIFWRQTLLFGGVQSWTCGSMSIV